MQPSVENMLDTDQKGDAISVEKDAAKLDAIIAEKDAIIAEKDEIIAKLRMEVTQLRAKVELDGQTAEMSAPACSHASHTDGDRTTMVPLPAPVEVPRRCSRSRVGAPDLVPCAHEPSCARLIYAAFSIKLCGECLQQDPEVADAVCTQCLSSRDAISPVSSSQATSPGSPDQSSSDGLDFGSDTLSDVVTNTASDTSMGTLCV